MAIDNIKAYSHLSDEDIREIGRRLDAIKEEFEADLGEKDVRYIKGQKKISNSLDNRFSI